MSCMCRSLGRHDQQIRNGESWLHLLKSACTYFKTAYTQALDTTLTSNTVLVRAKEALGLTETQFLSTLMGNCRFPRLQEGGRVVDPSAHAT